MKPYLKQFLPLIISLLLCSCSPQKQLVSDEHQQSGQITKFSTLGVISESLLFKASIDLFGDHYSGLLLIKSTKGDSAIRVLFLSELGITLLDLEYQDDKFGIISVKEFLNRPSILKMLQKDFRTLLLDLSQVQNYSISEDGEGAEMIEILKFKHGKERYKYYFRESTGTYQIRRKKGVLGKSDLFFAEKEGLNIRIKHRGIKLTIELQKLNQLEENADK
jgi:hypothetical protein